MGQAVYHQGREGRAEFNEMHAGVVYQDHETRTFLAGTTGEGDKRIQAYTFRLCLTTDPANSVAAITLMHPDIGVFDWNQPLSLPLPAWSPADLKVPSLTFLGPERRETDGEGICVLVDWEEEEEGKDGEKCACQVAEPKEKEEAA